MSPKHPMPFAFLTQTSLGVKEGLGGEVQTQAPREPQGWESTPQVCALIHIPGDGGGHPHHCLITLSRGPVRDRAGTTPLHSMVSWGVAHRSSSPKGTQWVRKGSHPISPTQKPHPWVHMRITCQVSKHKQLSSSPHPGELQLTLRGEAWASAIPKRSWVHSDVQRC